MGEVINLKEARKRRARQDKKNRAAQNRVLHGRTKAEITRERDESARRRAELDRKLLEDRRGRDESSDTD